jgi:F-type H+-transporting ATPase subunit a
MQEHEAWLTALLNRYLAGPANSILQAVNIKVEDPAHPWSDWLAIELLVVVLIVVLFAFLRRSLSAENPGKLQHIFEIVYGFIKGQTDDTIEHNGSRFLPFFGTLFIFILFMNLIGVIPGFESPTMTPAVPAGLAVSTFLFYNWAGFREQGIGRYLAHFAGPMPLLAPLMVPIELISHLARPLSLSIRLFANMFAGEKVTLTFLGLTYLIVPSVFMGLHVFVSFLQAYIFTLLTIIYVSGAVAHEH